MADLACYKLRTPPDGPVSDFDDAILEKRLAELSQTGPITIGGATAKLYMKGGFSQEPPWGGFLRSNFGDDLSIPKVASASAVIVLRLARGDEKAFVAFTFGYGFMLLRPEAYERGFGLKTSLNIIFEGDDGTDAIDPARLRSIDAKRVGTTVLRSRHQVADSSSLEELDVDVRRDLLNGVTGTPVSQERWGTRVTGKDAIYVGMDVEALGLDGAADRILTASQRGDYSVRFSFVDDLQLEADPVTRARLEEEVLGCLQAELLGGFGLAPPDIVDWERVTGFRYHSDRQRNPVLIRRELRLSDYIGSLKSAGQFNDLTVDKLKGYLIRPVNSEGKGVDQWTAWRCLFGELKVGDKPYILDDGDFYAVSEEYLKRVDDDIKALPECDKSFPDWISGTWEQDYNKQLASSSSRYLLLDRKLVKVATHTTTIELCDVLTDDGAFIHVKRGSDGSSSLSHLFAQGFVSGDLLVGPSEFRKEALKEIRKAAKKRAKDEGDDSFIGRFETFSVAGADPAKHEVVFALLGLEGDASALPFFSKVMLRQIADDLRRRNLKVSVKLVPGVYGEIKGGGGAS